MAKLCSRSEPGGRCRLGHYQLAAKIELPVACLGLVQRHVRLVFVRPEQMNDLMAARVEKLRDQAAVAAPPEGFFDFYSREILPEAGALKPNRASSRTA